MRRKDREVTDVTRITAIMDQCDSCRLGLCEDNVPYIVPLCFGYEQNGEAITLYFHSAGEGRKLDLIRKNPTVAFEMDTSRQLFGQNDETACIFGMHFESVMGIGTARILTDDEEKKHGFDFIMADYTDKKLPYTEQYLHAAAVIAVEVTSISCKVNL